MPQSSYSARGLPPRRRLLHHELPEVLGELAKAPQEAQLWGTIPPGPTVAIVGTRHPSKQGAWHAFHLARRLSKAGVTVISGGAEGIDTAAHLGAIAGGGRTLVVAPLWFEKAYPSKNRPLFEAILHKGGGYLCVSEEETQPLPYVFFRRNEILVALSQVLVLGQCPIKSGAKNAMLHARRLGRDRYILAFPFGEQHAAGSYQEFMRGGAELLFEPKLLLERLLSIGSFDNQKWWEWSSAHLQQEEASAERRREKRQQSVEGRGAMQTKKVQRGRNKGVNPSTRNPVEEAVVRALSGGATTIEEICESCGLSPAKVQHQVLLFTLEGSVYEDGSGLLRYQDAL